jgi:hypothetical protein
MHCGNSSAASFSLRSRNPLRVVDDQGTRSRLREFHHVGVVERTGCRTGGPCAKGSHRWLSKRVQAARGQAQTSRMGSIGDLQAVACGHRVLPPRRGCDRLRWRQVVEAMPAALAPPATWRRWMKVMVIDDSQDHPPHRRNPAQEGRLRRGHRHRRFRGAGQDRRPPAAHHLRRHHDAAPGRLSDLRADQEQPALPRTPVIMLSSKDGLFDKAKGRIVGSEQYLTKPFTRERFWPTTSSAA